MLGFSACRVPPSGGRSVRMVKTDTVKVCRHELQTSYPGRIRPAADVDLAFRVAGPILDMPVEIGRYVRKGQVIARIDPRDYELQFRATEAEYRQVKAEAERVMELYRRKSVPVNDYDKAVSGLRQISSKHSAHENARKDTELRAPFNGYIQKKYFDAGETVAAGMPVISMIDTHYFEVEADIPSADYVRRGLFRRFHCVADVFPEHVFPLELVDIARKANLNQLYRMRFRLRPEAGFPLAAGMSVNVTVECEPAGAGLTEVPLSAVFGKGGETSVWIYRPGENRVERRGVRVSRILKSGRAVLDSGVQAGEIVVTAGVHRLEEGMAVEPLKPVSRTNVGALL